MNTVVISPLVQIILCFILLLIIIVKSELKRTEIKVYFLFLTGITIQGILILLLRISSTTAHLVEWQKWIWFEIPFLNALMLHFSLALSKRKLKLPLLVLIYFTALVFSIFPLRYMVISGITGTLGDYHLIYAIAYYPSIAFSILGMLLSIILIWTYTMKSLDAEERNRNSYILLGIIIYLLMMLIGGLDIWDVLASPTYTAALVANIAFCILTTISIIKYHLLDINIVLRRSLALIIMSLILAVPYAILLSIYINSNEFLIPLLILITLLFHPLWLQITKLIDRLLYSPRYRFRQFLKPWQGQFYNITEINTFAKSIATMINYIFPARGIYILNRSNSGNYTIIASSLEPLPSIEINKNNGLITLLMRGENLYIDDLKNIVQSTMEQNLLTQLNELEIVLIVPLKNRREMLIGIILLSKKIKRRPYSQEDKFLISVLTKRLGQELDNARLYAVETKMRKDLEEQNRLKTNFLNKIALDLKTPLVNIIESSEALNNYKETKLNQQERLLTQNIQRGAWWLERRVSELADFASTKSDIVKLDIKPLNIRDLIIDSTSQLEYIFRNKEQTLEIDINTGLPLIMGDSDKLQQVLFNLLSNANKYSPAGSKIYIGAYIDNDNIIIDVRDSAAPISDDEKTRIFEPYYRSKNENIRRNIPGLGLGLTISKKLIELHNGKINIRNTVNGNIFSIIIPAETSKLY